MTHDQQQPRVMPGASVVRRRVLECLGALLLWALAGTCAAATTTDALDVRLDWLRTNLPVLLQQHQVPGGAVAVVSGGELVFSASFGRRDARGEVPVTQSTVFEAASLSKPVLALLALQLIQHGRLELDVPLVDYLGRDYLPAQPAHRTITARMVLTHRSGFPNWREGEDESAPLPVLFQPGTRDGYSGEGFLFLQRALEAITGEPLERLAAHSLFAPLGLRHTGFAWSEAIERELASGHDEGGAFKARSRYREANGAYTLYTTPAEYARLVLTLLRPEVLGERAFTAANVELMLQRQFEVADAELYQRPAAAAATARYRALGWAIEATRSGDIVQHGGANSTGFRAYVQFSRARGSALVLMTNGDNGGAVRDAVIAAVGDI